MMDDCFHRNPELICSHVSLLSSVPGTHRIRIRPNPPVPIVYVESRDGRRYRSHELSGEGVVVHRLGSLPEDEPPFSPFSHSLKRTHRSLKGIKKVQVVPTHRSLDIP